MGRQDSKRKRRSDYGSVQMTERDLYLLKWIGDQFGVRLDQLQHLAARMTDPESLKKDNQLSVPGIRRLVYRWHNAGWVEKQKLFAKQPLWVWLSRDGLSHAGLPYPYLVPSVARLNHIYRVNQVRMYIEKRRGSSIRWKSERLINPVRKKAGKKHVVDGEVMLEGQRLAIEVELTQKSQGRLDSILWELQKEYSGVWYFVTDEVYPVVKAAVNRLPPNVAPIFLLYRLSQLEV